MKKIGVGILGFGTVGAGVAEGLLKNRELLERRLGAMVELKAVADLDITTDRGIQIDRALLTTDASAVIRNPDIQIVVELIGGTGIARKFVVEAIEAGKSVVTANKKLLAEYGEEIFSLAEKKGVDIYFGASVGGGIPIIRVLREGLAGNEIRSIFGILNGTCNYILTRMENEGLPFAEVLAAAQKAGYAEADPTLDVDGWDTGHKAVILASLAYGFHVPLDKVSVSGIRNLSGTDVKYARELGYRIKLLAMIRRGENNAVEVRVHPTLVPIDNMLASVSNVFNAALVNGDMSGDTLYYGRGAGRAPTASTVIGDIADIARNLCSGVARHKRALVKEEHVTPVMKAEGDCSSRFYLRVMLKDTAGMMGRFTTLLGEKGVSITAVTQREAAGETSGFVPVVTLTNVARESDMDAALSAISASGIIDGAPVRLRVL